MTIARWRMKASMWGGFALGAVFAAVALAWPIVALTSLPVRTPHPVGLAMGLIVVSSVALALVSVGIIARRRLRRFPEGLLPLIPPFAFEVDDEYVRFPATLDRDAEEWPRARVTVSVRPAPLRAGDLARRVSGLGPIPGTIQSAAALVLESPTRRPRIVLGSALAEAPAEAADRIRRFLDGDESAAIEPDPEPDAPYRVWSSPDLLSDEYGMGSVLRIRAMLMVGIGGLLAVLALVMLITTVSVRPVEPVLFAVTGGLAVGAAATIVVGRLVLNRFQPDPALAAAPPDRRWVVSLVDGVLEFPRRFGAAGERWPLDEVEIGVEPDRWRLLRSARARRELVLSRHGVRRAFPAWTIAISPDDAARHLADAASGTATDAA